jgi:25S rRNA (uracil2634-N3)-methyltransferase
MHVPCSSIARKVPRKPPNTQNKRNTSTCHNMSKTKTKRARRELKRDGNRKIAAHHRKVAKATALPPSTTSKSSTKKQKTTSTTMPPAKSEAPAKPLQASQIHDVPFGEYDHILLVGEGDFSFTRSLALTHGCANITATSFDALPIVCEKYPTFSTIETELSSLTPPVPLHHAIDATKLSSYKALRCIRDDDTHGWDTIAFMFPHTGGLSTDVNRQVRANQALLVDFFKSCIETTSPARRLQILSSQRRRPTPLQPVRNAHAPFLRMHGRVIVTLFEGEPYTLWNVRDLARHAGLKVVESWKFDAAQYPGYAHVRTLGAIEGGGAWRGEEREARCYVFEKVELVADSEEEEVLERQGQGLRKKRRGGAAGGDGNRRVKKARAGSDSD